MAEQQEQEIGEAIARVFSDDNEGGLCCTLETVNSQGQDVAIQVMQDAINISPYPFQEDPTIRLQTSGILERFSDGDIEVIEWNSERFATVGIDGLEIDDVADLVDQVFVKLLACDDRSYTINATTEDLG
jgi:hypothetical protein